MAVANLRIRGCLAYVTSRRTRGRSPSTGHKPDFAPSLATVMTTRVGEFLEHETGNRVFSRDVVWQGNAFKNAPWIPWPDLTNLYNMLPTAPQGAVAAPAAPPVLPLRDEGILGMTGDDLPAPAAPAPMHPLSQPAVPVMASAPAAYPTAF